VKEFQRQKFGFEGALFKERTRWIQPIQDRVSQAIQELANSDSLDLILDKGSEVAIVFANYRIDKRNETITKLGLKPNPSLSNSFFCYTCNNKLSINYQR